MKRQRRRTLRVAQAAKDPHSLGNMLLDAGISDSDSLDHALQFQRDNPDVMLGEALIRLGRIDRDTLDNMLLKQAAHKDKSAKTVTRFVRTVNAQLQQHTKDMQDLRSQVLALIK